MMRDPGRAVTLPHRTKSSDVLSLGRQASLLGNIRGGGRQGLDDEEAAELGARFLAAADPCVDLKSPGAATPTCHVHGPASVVPP